MATSSKTSIIDIPPIFTLEPKSHPVLKSIIKNLKPDENLTDMLAHQFKPHPTKTYQMGGTTYIKKPRPILFMLEQMFSDNIKLSGNETTDRILEIYRNETWAPHLEMEIFKRNKFGTKDFKVDIDDRWDALKNIVLMKNDDDKYGLNIGNTWKPYFKKKTNEYYIYVFENALTETDLENLNKLLMEENFDPDKDKENGFIRFSKQFTVKEDKGEEDNGEATAGYIPSIQKDDEEAVFLWKITKNNKKIPFGYLSESDDLQEKEVNKEELQKRNHECDILIQLII